ncbi:MAG: hypothetical protein L6R40_006917 [Gallowayella cf. fulva]|nr:MAG: hypothetical protein L6R40_006917 [Xanthomendoza cf. fulva]
MSNGKLTAAILIVSDTAFQDPSTDKAGSTLVDAFNQRGSDQWSVSDTQIVADNVLAIQRQVTTWCDRGGFPNLVITTGGTGFTEKDNTPEAISPLLHKHASGLVHGMLAASLDVTPSRPISNDPKEGPTQRYRESPYPMETVDDALKIILRNTPAPKVIKVPVDGSIVGCVLAEDVQADEPVPAFRASIVDGYAIILDKEKPHSQGVFPVASVSHASPGDSPSLQAGQIARITTGAPLPTNATSVVMLEDTKIRSKTDDGQEEKEIEIMTDNVALGENVREAGSDVKAGETILREGAEVTAIGGELGLLASVGKKEISVYRRPVVGVLSTGDEIVSHDRPGSLRLGEVRDTNRPSLMAAIQGWGFQTVDLGIASDEQGSLEQNLRDAMRKVDVIVTSGGVSMGELDLLKPTIERSLGGTIHFGRVSMKPGKPTTFATVPFKNNAGEHETRLVFSLPGNPASAIVTAHLFVLPSLQHTCGIRPVGLPKVMVMLDHDFPLDPKRPEYHRVTVTADNQAILRATSTGGQRSSRVGSLRSANALLCLPAKDGSLSKGELIESPEVLPALGFPLLKPDPSTIVVMFQAAAD